MIDVDGGLFTVAVFQDVAWAQKAIAALTQAGFAVNSLTIVAKDSPDAASLVERTFGQPAQRLELAGLGQVIATGPLVTALQREAGDLPKLGLAGTMQRVGFQSHDGLIFERLTARGGVLVAIRDEPRVSDALAICHSYGGGNAAIGAWRGRV